MNRTFTLPLLTGLLLLARPLTAQLGPLNWTGPVQVESNNLFLIWNEHPEIGNQVHQKTYDYQFHDANLPVDERLTQTPRHTTTGAAGYTDAANGKFNYGPRDNAIAIWGPGPSGITVSIPRFDTSAMAWTEAVEHQIAGDIQNDRIHVRTLDVDADSLDEYVIAYLDSEDSLHIQLYDVNEDLQSTFVDGICDFRVIAPAVERSRVAITTGDFNGDGIEEVAVLRNLGPSGFHVYVELRIYAFAGGTWGLRGTYDNFLVGFNGSVLGFELSPVAGDFIEGGGQEIAIVTSVQHAPGRKVQFGVVSVSADLQTITGGAYFTPTYSFGKIKLGAASADLCGDGRDELVVVSGAAAILAHMTSGDSMLVRPAQILDYNDSYGDYGLRPGMHDHIRLSDVDQDGRCDLVAVYDKLSSGSAGFDVQVHAIDSLDGFTLTGRLTHDEDQPIPATDPPQYDHRPYAFVTGNYDGLNFTIGEPTHHVSADVVNPVVILNAPPVHFDQLDGELVDLNTCYNGGECDFGATYRKVTSSSIEVSSTVRSEWLVSSGYSVSGSVEVSVEPLGVGVGTSINYENHLLVNYGENFSLTNAASTTVTIGVEVTAAEDDRIYSTITQYDVWEYPLYHGNETVPRNTILTLEPLDVSATWYPSKSYNAVSYTPDHEVGNVLSYPAFANLADNPNMAQPIAADYDNDSFVLDGSSDYDWFLSITDFESTQADTAWTAGVDLGFGIGVFRFDGDYSQSEAMTHLNTVTDQIDLNVHLGNVDMSVGDAKYTVTPYAYWDGNGALVVDYAARPEIAPPGFPDTWWQQEYGQLPDPSFVLPWKLDPEKGFALSEEAKREQTKDIIFDKAYPLPGDTLLITARVRNFSLLATTAPVTVSFYIGDPDDGGIPLIGLTGTHTTSTNGPVAAQGRADVNIEWAIPSDLPAYPRIYAVLDEGGAMAEIHEGNNTGFNVLGWASGEVNVDELQPAAHAGLLCYPNPFQHSTTLAMTLATSGSASLTIMDPLGREVRRVFDADLPAGTRTVDFDASGLPDGLYIAVLRTEEGTLSSRLVLAR